MRTSLPVFFLLSLLAFAAPARSADVDSWMPTWVGPSTFELGETYTLMFDQPGISGFEALEGPAGVNGTNPFTVTYDPTFIDRLVVVPGTVSTDFVFVEPLGPVLPVGQNPIKLSIYGMVLDVGGVDVPEGSLFGIQFRVIKAGTSSLSAAYALLLVDPSDPMGSLSPGPDGISTSIVAVPEPGTWAMMLVGLGLVGACAMRARRGS